MGRTDLPHTGDRKQQKAKNARIWVYFRVWTSKQTAITAHKSLSLCPSPTTVSWGNTLPFPLTHISCFHSHRVHLRQSLIEMIQPKQMPDHRCSPSLPLWWMWLRNHFNSITKHSPIVTQADMSLQEYRCRIITRQCALWISGTCCKHYTLQEPFPGSGAHIYP